MQMKREVGEKGQVVIPKDIREHIGIKPGTQVVFDVRDDGVVIKPAKTGKEFVDYFCKTSNKLKKPLSMRKLKKTLEEEYDIS